MSQTPLEQKISRLMAITSARTAGPAFDDKPLDERALLMSKFLSTFVVFQVLCKNDDILLPENARLRSHWLREANTFIETFPDAKEGVGIAMLYKTKVE